MWNDRLSGKEYWTPGGFLRICDRCGRRRRNWDTAKEWTGLIVCTDGCLEARHPQDHVRGVADNQRVPDPRPEPPDEFLGVNEVQPEDL